MRRQAEDSDDELMVVDAAGEHILKRGRLRGLALVSGQIFLKEWMKDEEGNFVRLHRGLEGYVDFRSVEHLHTDFRTEQDLVVFSGIDMDGKPGVWVNYVKISDMGIAAHSRITFSNADNVLSTQLAGNAHRTEFDLVELGIVS